MQRSADGGLCPGLRVEGIACARGGKALFGPLDFAVKPGAALFVLGPNGSGKSTLLRALAGLSEAACGQGYWDGEAIRFDSPAWRSRVAYLGHRLGHKEELTVDENLTLAAQLAGETGSADQHLAALARVGLDRRRLLAVRRLSQGQKQRLALARLCLSTRPVWLLDEPAAALDSDAKAVLAAILDTHLRAQGLAVVATHDGIETAAERAAHLRLA